MFVEQVAILFKFLYYLLYSIVGRLRLSSMSSTPFYQSCGNVLPSAEINLQYFTPLSNRVSFLARNGGPSLKYNN